jgi:hypothetical protein
MRHYDKEHVFDEEKWKIWVNKRQILDITVMLYHNIFYSKYFASGTGAISGTRYQTQAQWLGATQSKIPPLLRSDTQRNHGN